MISRATRRAAARPSHLWRPKGPTPVALILCAYRSVSLPTFHSLLPLCAAGGDPSFAWSLLTKTGDALISRARSVVASRWYLDRTDEAFLMVDDDITFSPSAAEAVMRRCLEGFDVICGAYPVRDAGHLALRPLDGVAIAFGLGQPPVEIEYAATGFMAVRRRVIAKLASTLEFCSEGSPFAFWPLFAPMVVPLDGRNVYLSEDWAFCQRARAAGFKMWVDPSVRIGHIAEREIDLRDIPSATIERAKAAG